MKKFTYPTAEQRTQILKDNNEPYDRRIRESECASRSGLSRSRRWQLEQMEAFPKRTPVGRNSVSWLLSDILWWVHNPPEVENVNNPHSRKTASSDERG